MTLQDEKGSATAPTVPSHGSTNPAKDQKMNNTEYSTTAASAPDRNYKRPSEQEILDALEPVDWQISELRRAAMVADEYINMEIRSGNLGRFADRCVLNSEQVDGILYMLSHVRELAADLEKATDRAYGREASR